MSGASDLANIKRSFDKWFGNTFGSSYAIDYDGVPFDSANRSEWLQPRLLFGGRHFHRQISSTQRGNTLEVIANVNIFVKKGTNTPADRIFRLRDALHDQMEEFTSITIYDYTAGTSASLGEMRSREIITDMRIPEEKPEEPTQWNFSVVYTFLERY